MTNALIYHIVSGQAFFSGVALIWLAAILAIRPSGRWSSLGRTSLACVGLILITVSATPLRVWFYVVAGAGTITWIWIEGLSRERFRKARIWLRFAVPAAWCLGVALEAPYHLSPSIAAPSDPLIYVVGDSLSAGMGGEAKTWPKILASTNGLTVANLSVAGADVSKAMEQAERMVEPGSFVVAEIGGNDVLGGTTPEAFERDLDALLARLRSDGRTVILLELPLPPFYNRFGEIQRRLARRHGAKLVPKRVLIGVLTAGDATLDSIHLSATGHARMAEAIRGILRPALEHPP